MEKLKRQHDNITYTIEPRIVRIWNDEPLKELLSRGKRKAALTLAAHIREDYERERGDALKISTRSLACEIYDHYLLLKMSEAAEKVLHRNIRPVRWMKRHMNVIDCGERIEDNNRFLWDMFSVFWKRKC